jgi:signal transduction histidine kinase
MKQDVSLFEAAFEFNPVAQVVIHRDNRLSRWNRAFQGIVGLTPTDQLFTGLLNDECVAAITSFLTKTVEHNSSEKVEILSPFKGSAPCQLHSLIATPICATGVDDFLLISVQVLNSQGELAELKKQVQKDSETVQRLSKELEVFSYSVSHDLRSPLRTVLGFGAALQEDYGDSLDEEAKNYLDRIASAARRMDELIKSILVVSRISRAPINITEVDLSAMVRDLLDGYLRSRPDVEVIIQPGVTVNADPDLTKVIIANLLENACKFTAKEPHARIEFGVDDSQEGSPIFIRDNGIGFDQEYAEKIFEPFERLHPVSTFPGSGMGLSNVRRIVTRHEGTTWGVGESGKGSTFYFVLP